MSAAKLKVTRSTISSSSAKSQFDMSMLLAVVLLVMALLQIVSFSAFSDWFSAIGYSNGSSYAILVIILEILGALGFVRLALPSIVRTVSRICAVLAAGFWFITSIRLVTDSMSQVSSSGFFGKYLTQAPSWWTVFEATLLMLWTLYALEATKQ